MATRIKTLEEIKTLQEAIVYFSDPDNCIAYLSAKRWKDGVVLCPHCGSSEVKYMASRRVWQCKTRHPKSQFSIKVGTVYEDSAIGLDKWLAATWMSSNCKNGISSYEVARDLGVTQKTAWFMLHRIRFSMQDEQSSTLSGHVEVDETFIGGKARNMHKDVRARKITGTGGSGKVVVMGMLERGGKVKTKVISDRSRTTLQDNIINNVAACAEVFTDELPAYSGLEEMYNHEVVNHAEEYVRGKVHTNGLENFWSLLKRGLNGTYVSVQPFHLFRYLDEQTFRYNNRKTLNDRGRFDACVAQGIGKRLTYKQLTGKTEEEPF
jgi:transposase-like protein